MHAVDQTVEYYAARAPVYDATSGYEDPEGERLRVPAKIRYQRLFRGLDVLEVACGTGYWTAVVGEVAESVLATDINPAVVGLAEERCRSLRSVRFRVVDALSLKGVPPGFTGALGMWWWSHVPKSALQGFLRALHSRLRPGSPVLFNDQLPYGGRTRESDAEGNTLELRTLPDGRCFRVMKNFPTERELRTALHGIADDVEYRINRSGTHWELQYRTRRDLAGEPPRPASPTVERQSHG